MGALLKTQPHSLLRPQTCSGPCRKTVCPPPQRSWGQEAVQSLHLPSFSIRNSLWFLTHVFTFIPECFHPVILSNSPFPNPSQGFGLWDFVHNCYHVNHHSPDSAPAFSPSSWKSQFKCHFLHAAFLDSLIEAPPASSGPQAPALLSQHHCTLPWGWLDTVSLFC